MTFFEILNGTVWPSQCFSQLLITAMYRTDIVRDYQFCNILPQAVKISDWRNYSPVRRVVRLLDEAGTRTDPRSSGPRPERRTHEEVFARRIY